LLCNVLPPEDSDPAGGTVYSASMPTSYRLNLVDRMVWSRAWGVVRNEALTAHSRALRADPRFQPDFRQLQDFLSVERTEITAAGLRELASLNPFGAGARRAVVVPSDELFGLARMHELLRQPGRDELQVFREIAPALEWLGLPPGWTPPPPDPHDPVFE